jgi:hypothetical protein
MLVLVLACISAAAIAYVCAEVVPLNPICPLYDDVVSMSHDISSQKVQVILRPQRLCSDPSLILRLSGPALYKLDYQGMVNTTQMYSYPPLIDPGQYFLEAVAIYCSAYFPDDPHTQCIENHHYGRNILTLPYNFTVQHPAVSGPPRPRWKRATGIPKPLATRHQRFPSEPHPGLKCDKLYGPLQCASEEAELVPYLEYNWTDAQPWLPTANVVLEKHSSYGRTHNKGRIIVCFVGDSHSYYLHVAVMELVASLKLPWLEATIIRSVFPVLFNVSSLDETHCSVAIFSFAIWPLMYSPFPHTAEEHRRQITAMIDDVQRNYRGPSRMFFRSENINGLGRYAGWCPASYDRRSPPAFDALNAVTREVCEARNVTFIDLDQIIYPMWDSALDYCHPPSKVFVAEAEHVLRRVFHHIIGQDWQVPLLSTILPEPPAKILLGATLAMVHERLCQDRECRPL